jgi:hypothetical protein
MQPDVVIKDFYIFENIPLCLVTSFVMLELEIWWSGGRRIIKVEPSEYRLSANATSELFIERLALAQPLKKRGGQLTASLFHVSLSLSLPMLLSSYLYAPP